MIVLFSVLCLFLGPFYMIYKPPSFLIRYFQSRWSDVLWRVPISTKVVALTIDDGPSEYTNEIMQIIKENDSKATFFLIGSQIPTRKEVLKDLILNKNELGNHAMHDEPSRSLNDATLVEQIHTVDDMIMDAYAAADVTRPAKYFRPGSGFFSDKMRSVMDRLGYKLVLGSIYPHDPQIPYWRVNANHILSMIQPGGIIICHDRRPWTVPMLRTVLPEIKKKGYRVVTVTELLQEAEK